METLIIKPATRSKMEALKAFLAALKMEFTSIAGDSSVTAPQKDNTAEEEDMPYNPEFVAKIKASQQEIRDGKGVKVKLEDLWK